MSTDPQPRRWQSLRDAAAASMAPNTAAPEPASRRVTPSQAAATARAILAGTAHQIREVLRAGQAGARQRPSGRSAGSRRRTDLRLVPAAVLVWGTALAGGGLAPPALAALCAGLAAAAGLLLLPRRRHRQAAARSLRGTAAAGLLLLPRRRHRQAAARSLRGTAAAALLLSCAAGAHAAVASVPRHEGAVAEAVAAGASVVAEIEVSGMPRRLATPGRSGLSDRWAVPATLRVLIFDGRRVEAHAGLLVLGGAEWGDAASGQRLRTTGKLKPAGPGEADAGMLSASSVPVRLAATAGWDRAPAGLRSSFSAASAGLPGDAKGLLPGMVTGDTEALDPQLAAAMKTVGMTHLTAVSGANCSLVLGVLLLAARSLRFTRPAAAGLALGGLGMFVLMVGPDASVLRAACMGAIGLSALVFGRAGRGLSLLCVASTALLLAEPALAADFGFLLSVLATLGIVVAGRPIMGWVPSVVPRAVAAGFAVPLSAQLFCGPVIVLLQPQFSSYALPANLAAAALVAPVTVAGTAAVPLVPLVPALAAVPIAVAGTFAAGVAGIARYFAALPGAALPWPEGAYGSATMAALSGLSLAGVWLVSHPAAAVRLLLKLQERTALFLGRVLDRKADPPVSAHSWAGRWTRRRPGQRGLVHRPRRGRLRVCKPTSRRNHEWLLPRPNAPGPRLRRPPPGAM
ncbi:ComEC/Rec2 family competence protein [Arthrobacter sp. UYEF3]|uniref:ComEC/Rec2 family competence protein n=1 Tax=Arthrobacter sp. UYEF3 TaxID=1756365 RepID=UPI00339B37D3